MSRTTSRATASLRRTFSTRSHVRPETSAESPAATPLSSYSIADDGNRASKRLSFSSIRARATGHCRAPSKLTFSYTYTNESSQDTLTLSSTPIDIPRKPSRPPTVHFEPESASFLQSFHNITGPQALEDSSPSTTADTDSSDDSLQGALPMDTTENTPVRKAGRICAVVETDDVYGKPYRLSRTTTDHWRTSSQTRLSELSSVYQDVECASSEARDQSTSSNEPQHHTTITNQSKRSTTRFGSSILAGNSPRSSENLSKLYTTRSNPSRPDVEQPEYDGTARMMSITRSGSSNLPVQFPPSVETPPDAATTQLEWTEHPSTGPITTRFIPADLVVHNYHGDRASETDEAKEERRYQLFSQLVDRGNGLPFAGMSRAHRAEMVVAGADEILENMTESPNNIENYQEYHFIPSGGFVQRLPPDRYTWATSLAEYQRLRSIRFLDSAKNNSSRDRQRNQFLQSKHHETASQPFRFVAHDVTASAVQHPAETEVQSLCLATNDAITQPQHLSKTEDHFCPVAHDAEALAVQHPPRPSSLPCHRQQNYASNTATGFEPGQFQAKASQMAPSSQPLPHSAILEQRYQVAKPLPPLPVRPRTPFDPLPQLRGGGTELSDWSAMMGFDSMETAFAPRGHRPLHLRGGGRDPEEGELD